MTTLHASKALYTDAFRLLQGNLEIAMQLDTAIRDISSDRPNGELMPFTV